MALGAFLRMAGTKALPMLGKLGSAKAMPWVLRGAGAVGGAAPGIMRGDLGQAIVGGGLGAAGGGALGHLTGLGAGKCGLVGGALGAGLGHVLSTDAAKEARERGRRGALPEFGLSEGLGQLIPGLQNLHPAFRPDSATGAIGGAAGAALPQGVRF